MKREVARGWVGKGALVGLVAGTLSLATAFPAGADEAALMQEIALLKSRLAELEAKVNHAASSVPVNGGVAVPSGQPIQISGFVDTSYTYNFDVPQTNTNTLRVFDTRANSFMINNAELVVEKPATAESRTGFRVDLDFGTDAEVVGSVTTGLGSTTNELDIQQAYAEYLAPIGNGLDFKVGKFVTLHGAEVIESKDNWNLSRSFLFGFAIPFTHTGIRASYPWADWLSTTVGVSNGFDVVDDNNQGKTIEAGATLTPFEHASLTGTFMTGAEQTGNNNNQRQLIDLVASYQLTDALAAKLNFDYGWEDDAVAFAKNASWTGLAGYLRYQLTPKFALAGRAEWLHDADGVRTGLRTGLNGITGTDINLYEYTLTGEYKLNDHLLARLEYRHDQGSQKVFRAHDLTQRAYQDTLGVEFIAPF